MADARTNVAFPYTFGAKTGSGAPRLGLVTANFTITVRNPQNTATMAAPTVAEIGGGQYRFVIAASFTNTHGAGAYGVTVNLTLAPTDLITDIVTFTVDDSDTLSTRIPAALVGGRMDSDVGNMQTDVLDAAALATDAVNEIAAATEALILATPGQPIATDASGRVNANVQQWLGVAVNALVAGRVPVDVQTWLGTAVAALQAAGRVDVSVGNMQAAVITAASIAGAAITAAKFATDAIDANAIAADAATEIGDAVDVVLTGAHGAGAWTSASSTDWSSVEREQIRSRLGIDGTRTLPAFVGSSLVDLVFSLADTIFTGHNLARALRNIYSTTALATTGDLQLQSFKDPAGAEQHATDTDTQGQRVVTTLGV